MLVLFLRISYLPCNLGFNDVMIIPIYVLQDTVKANLNWFVMYQRTSKLVIEDRGGL